MFNPESFVDRVEEAGLRASVTMVTFNRWGCTHQSLTSILEYTYLPHTLTVVDNGSWDGTREKLKEFKRAGQIDKLILLPENRGIAVGKNFGLKASEGQAAWYCCIDNDIEVSPRWLSYLCFASTLPGLGIVGSNVQRFGLPGGPTLFKPSLWKAVEGVSLDYCPNPGGLYVVSAATFEKLGYFIERSLYGLEDSEWYLRQKHYELRSVYVRNAVCVQLPDEKFPMQDGESYRNFKTRTHASIVAEVRTLAKQGVRKEPKHYETTVTLQDVKKYSWGTT